MCVQERRFGRITGEWNVEANFGDNNKIIIIENDAAEQNDILKRNRRKKPFAERHTILINMIGSLAVGVVLMFGFWQDGVTKVENFFGEKKAWFMSLISGDESRTGNTVANSENTGMKYIILDSDSRYLTKDELTSLTPQQCNYARNEIYARRGRKFRSIELQEYFATKEWYEPLYEPDYFDKNIKNICNDYEIKNGEVIQAFESEKGKYELDRPGYNIYAVI